MAKRLFESVPDFHFPRLKSSQAPARRARLRCGEAANCHAVRNTGHENTRNRAIINLLPLVRRVAFGMHARFPAHIEVDDLVGAGVLGLVDAVERFDNRRHVKLESYAQHRIRGAILDSLRSMDTASREVRNRSKKAEKVHRQLELTLGHPATDDEMARGMGISLENWHRTAQQIHAAGADWLRPMRWAGTRQPETLAAEDQKTQFDLCYLRERRELVSRVLACLPERERTVIELYHGKELTMSQIGKMLKIDESRVSQLHSAAIDRLRSGVQAILRRPRLEMPPTCGLVPKPYLH